MTHFRPLFISLVLTWCLVGCGENSEETKTGHTATLTPELAQGKAIVDANCFVCHAQGINGAPIIGNIKMWGKRLPQGLETLIDHAINGYAGMMPPKGGNPDLTDEEIRLAVTYMVSQVKDKTPQ